LFAFLIKASVICTTLCWIVSSRDGFIKIFTRLSTLWLKLDGRSAPYSLTAIIEAKFSSSESWVFLIILMFSDAISL